jgi:hypothetical protein
MARLNWRLNPGPGLRPNQAPVTQPSLGPVMRVSLRALLRPVNLRVHRAPGMRAGCCPRYRSRAFSSRQPQSPLSSSRSWPPSSFCDPTHPSRQRRNNHRQQPPISRPAPPLALQPLPERCCAAPTTLPLPRLARTRRDGCLRLPSLRHDTHEPLDNVGCPLGGRRLDDRERILWGDLIYANCCRQWHRPGGARVGVRQIGGPHLDTHRGLTKS